MVLKEIVKYKRWLKNFLIVAFLSLGAICTVMPFIWMMLGSMKSLGEIIKIPPTFFPKNPTLNNFRVVFDTIAFGRYYLNSILVSVVTTVIIVFTSALAGYVFSKFKFFAVNIMFILILSTLMIPFQMIMVPLYLVIRDLRVLDSYWALILPGLVSAFGIFLMKQFIETIPRDLIDAGRIDGCSEFGIFLKIILPLVVPALGALGIFTFMAEWNSYLWPLIVIDADSLRTIPLGLAALSTQHATRHNLVMAGASLAVIPVIVVVIIFQRHFVKGITLTGLKG